MNTQKPNILFIMADQMIPFLTGAYGHPVVKTPHMDILAARGVRFAAAYCNAPLCAPSRFSFMSGQLVTRIAAYDNASEFSSAVPTFAHYLKIMGYRTCLSGKPGKSSGWSWRAAGPPDSAATFPSNTFLSTARPCSHDRSGPWPGTRSSEGSWSSCLPGTSTGSVVNRCDECPVFSTSSPVGPPAPTRAGTAWPPAAPRRSSWSTTPHVPGSTAA